MRQHKRSSIGSIVLPIVLIVGFGIVLAGWFFLNSLMSPLDPTDSLSKMFVVNKGQGFNSIAQKLVEEKLIKSAWSLKIASYFTPDKGKSIQAGSFRLSSSMTPAKILQELAHGKLDIWVTILEGLRREEIADAIATTFEENNLSFDKATFLNLTKSDEGYLFPDKYLFPVNTDATTIASILKNTLTKKITPETQAAIDKSGHSFHQILTMASLIEREANSLESRKIVSGILWKRIENGWPLQVDATLQYSKGYDPIQQTWWDPPLGIDKEIKSPYNTYLNQGLPPGPICSPSLSSIEAAVNPTKSAYWYYLTDNQGIMHYSETIEQHNRYVNQYLR